MRGRLVFLALILASLTVASCSSSSAGITFDLKRADALAHAALIRPGDLPGSGWQTVADDRFETAGDYSNFQDCSGFEEIFKRVDEGLVGHAERLIQRPALGSILLVDLEVGIYRDSRTASGLSAL
jgi:predicted small secreted protein